MTSLAFSPNAIARPTPEAFTPLYIQIAESIADLIRSQGASAIGKILPSEIECMHRLGVSRPTVRQAMSHLSSQGLITRHKGRGTFITDTKLDHNIGRIFEDEMRSNRRQFSAKILEWKRVTMSDELLNIFGHDNAREVYKLARLRLVDRKIIGLEERYLPTVIGDRISIRELKTELLWPLLARLTEQRQVKMTIIVSSELANAAQAKLLEVRAGTPLLVRRNTCYFQSGRPMLQGTTKFISRNYQFRFDTTLNVPE